MSEKRTTTGVVRSRALQALDDLVQVDLVALGCVSGRTTTWPAALIEK